MDNQRIAFLLRSTYDLLPSPTNLHLWGKEENPFCKLCGKPANLEHILSSCQRALTEGRYRWRHDRVLRVMAREMEKEVKKSRPGQKKVVFIPFVRSGEAAKQKAERAGLLHSSPQWKMEVDLDKRLVFPMQIVTTRLRPDIIIWSESPKMVVMVELTVPWEERMVEATERKRGKYQELVEQCQEQGWRTWCLPVEVGARGFAGGSLWRTLKTLGITGRSRKNIIDSSCQEAERSSRWLWLRREERWSSPPVPSQA